MALYKQLVTTAPYQYGDVHEFSVCVVNQGNQDVYNLEVTDYLPTGYTFDASMNTGWSVSGDNLVNVISGPIEACDTVCLALFLNFEQTTGGRNNWINYAEITEFQDVDGNVLEDVDSTPGSDGPDERDVYPGDDADDDIDSTDKGGEEDDHDPAGPKVFDLALYMVNDTDILGAYGDNVEQTIYVTNQGNIASDGFDVTVYVPAGYTFSTSNNPGWVDNGDGTVTYVSTDMLAPGATLEYTLNLTAVPTKEEDGWLVYAEISRDNSTDPNVTTDIDSRPDNNRDNDSGGAVNTDSDNVVTGVGIDRNGNPTDVPGSTNPLTDEDDHDPTVIRVYDMALYKSLKTEGPYRYDQVLEFDVCVVNQGNQIMTNVGVIDYLPRGFEYVAANNPGSPWTVDGDNLVATIAGPIGVCDTVCLPVFLTVRQTTGGEKDWINYAEITGMQDESGTPRDDVDSTPGSDGPDERDVEPGDDADDDIDSIDKGGEEDDHDPAGIEIFDLAQRKTTDDLGPFRYNDVVKFTIEVFNQGSIQASGITVTDYIPCGFDYETNNNLLGWTYDATSGNATITLPGSLIPGSSTTVDLYLRVRPCQQSTNAWTNISEISDADSDDPRYPDADDIDSTPDTDPDNDGPVTDDEVEGDPNDPNNPDEDDHDIERIEVVDLALRKVVATDGPYRYGQVLDFEIEVFNQGNVTMTNIELVDYIPTGFEYDASINPIWSGAAPQVFTVIPGPLAPEASTTVTIRLKLVQTNGGVTNYTNVGEISDARDEDGNPRIDADSTPDTDPNNDPTIDDEIFGDPNDPTNPNDEDDNDIAVVEIFDLALRKTQETAGLSFSYGQNVNYRVTVFNQGNVPARDIQVVDYIPCGLLFEASNPINIANGWTYDPITRIATTTIPGVLMPGESVSVFIDNKVEACYDEPNTAWTNYAEIEEAINDNTGEPGEDIDSTPDNDPNNDPGGEPNSPDDDEINGDPNNPDNPDAPQDEDDHDPHQIQVFDLAIRKIVDDRGPYMLGETAVFRITVFNQGNVPATNVVVNDYVRRGFSFNPATNTGWSLTTPAGPGPNDFGLLNYTIGSVILPGDSLQLVLNLEVQVPDGGNVSVLDWWNYAEIGAAQDTEGNNRDDDADSVYNSDSDRENEVEPDGPWDNVIDGRGPNFNEDEDDHDVEYVIVVGGLGDTVWKDLDGNGLQDPGEPGVEGVTATLTDCEGNVLQTTVTDATGFYFFNNLIPGNYQVTFDISGLAPGCAFTYQNVGDNDEVDSDVNLEGEGPCVFINGGQYDSTYDAGLLILAAIGDFVWHDLNGDGQQNVGEPGIPGVQVNLYKGDGSYVGTTYTDVNGRYLFDFLYPGDYYLEFIDPVGFDKTFTNRGSDVTDSDVDNMNGPRTTQTTTLSPGERDMTWDAGYYKCIPIGDLVWYDINKNDMWDSNENGINGLKVNLWRNHFGTWLIWDHTLTGHRPGTPSDDGYYKFCAPPGEYYVEIIMPALGLVRARPFVGPDRTKDSDITNANGPTTTNRFTVRSGDERCDIGAGFYPQAMAGQLVWVDVNSNGIQDADEPRVEGVMVQAVELATGAVVNTTYTDADGIYELDGLEKQTYFLRFQPPAGMYPTVARAGADNVDSDVDGSNGPNTTRAIAFEPAMVNYNIDMGVSFAPLPVDWLGINAKRVNETHLVTWSVASEMNVSHYVVERRMSTDREFTQIPGEVKAQGNATRTTHYDLVDEDVSKSGVYVYRVKQYDYDGKFTYSPLAKVSHNGENSIDMYPNPARNETTVQVTLSEDAEVKIEMYDAASRLVKVIQTGSLQIAGDMIYKAELEDVPAGVYNVLITIDGVVTQKKLIRIE